MEAVLGRRRTLRALVKGVNMATDLDQYWNDGQRDEDRFFGGGTPGGASGFVPGDRHQGIHKHLPVIWQIGTHYTHIYIRLLLYSNSSDLVR